MFNKYDWGGYIIYKFYPKNKVFIDGRADVHGKSICEEYIKIRDLKPGWQATLEKYKVNFIIWDANSPLTEALSKQPDWKLVYIDDVAAVLLKNLSKAEQAIR